jgi:protein tyrosine phosphatase (PTP) superfamily phosphohydrolase (DUF442 family)
MDRDELRQHIVSCDKCVYIETTDLTGRNCSLCRQKIKSYESCFVAYCHTGESFRGFLLCQACMSMVDSKNHRITTMKSISDAAIRDFRKSLDEFKKRII